MTIINSLILGLVACLILFSGCIQNSSTTNYPNNIPPHENFVDVNNNANANDGQTVSIENSESLEKLPVDGNLTIKIEEQDGELSLKNTNLDPSRFDSLCEKDYCILWYSFESPIPIKKINFDSNSLFPIITNLSNDSNGQFLIMVLSQQNHFEYCGFNFLEKDRNTFNETEKTFESLCTKKNSLEKLTGLKLNENYFIYFSLNYDTKCYTIINIQICNPDTDADVYIPGDYQPFTKIISIHYIPSSFLGQIIFHEIVHEMTEKMNAPHWFDEGLAEFISWKALNVPHPPTHIIQKDLRKYYSFEKIVVNWEGKDYGHNINGDNYAAESIYGYDTATAIVGKLYYKLNPKGLFDDFLNDKRFSENNLSTEKEKTELILEIVNSYLPDKNYVKLEDIIETG